MATLHKEQYHTLRYIGGVKQEIAGKQEIKAEATKKNYKSGVINQLKRLEQVLLTCALCIDDTSLLDCFLLIL